MTKQQDDAFRPIARKVERRLAPEVPLMDALCRSLQYLFDIIFQSIENSGTEWTAVAIYYVSVVFKI